MKCQKRCPTEAWSDPQGEHDPQPASGPLWVVGGCPLWAGPSPPRASPPRAHPSGPGLGEPWAGLLWLRPAAHGVGRGQGLRREDLLHRPQHQEDHVGRSQREVGTDQRPAFKFRLVFFSSKSCVGHPYSRPSVDRFGKNFGGRLIKGQVKRESNFSQIGQQTAEMTQLLEEKNTNLNLKAGLLN